MHRPEVGEYGNALCYERRLPADERLLEFPHGSLIVYIRNFTVNSSFINQLRRISGQLAENIEASIINQILSELDFPARHHRFDAVSCSAQQTFAWIFDDSCYQLLQQSGLEVSFPDWLRSGSGVFHIAGKAGSGKSTLMKFICSARYSRELLLQWARGNQLITSNFFF